MPYSNDEHKVVINLWVGSFSTKHQTSCVNHNKSFIGYDQQLNKEIYSSLLNATPLYAVWNAFPSYLTESLKEFPMVFRSVLLITSLD
jgi:hypothetical protein